MTADELAIVESQLLQLFKPINGQRIKMLDNSAYIEAWDVLAHLGRIFGPLNWDKEVLREALIFEDYVTWTPRATQSKPNPTEKSGWDVAYTATVRLTVRTYLGVKVAEDVATGSANHQPGRADAHDLALKSAVSDALKRAAKDLGNQFGLSLYDKGAVRSVLGSSLAHPTLTRTATGTDPAPSNDDGLADAPMQYEEVNGEQIPLGFPSETTREGPPSTLPTPKQLNWAKSLLKEAGYLTDEAARLWFVEQGLPWTGALNTMSKVAAVAIIDTFKPPPE